MPDFVTRDRQHVVISYGVDVELSMSGKPPKPPGPVVPVPKPLHHDVQTWSAMREILWAAEAGVPLLSAIGAALVLRRLIGSGGRE